MRVVSALLIGGIVFQGFVPAAAPRPPQAGQLRITVVQGDGLVNSTRLQTAREIIIQVTDQENRAVPAATVVLQAPAAGASGTFPDGKTMLIDSTNDEGRLTTRFILNQVAGEIRIVVTASFRDQSATVAITQTNQEPAAPAPLRAKKSNTGTIIGILVAAGGGGAVAAATLGKKSGGTTPTPGPQPTPGTVLSAGTGTFGPPR